MPLEIDWESVYDGTVKPLSAGTDMWLQKPDEFEFTAVIDNQKTNKKFEIPIKPIPWSTDYLENVSYTLEWLLRDHRKEDMRFDEEAIVEHIRDFWYRSAHYEAEYTHVCYPQDILKFRSQYDTVYAQLLSLPKSAMSSHYLCNRDNCKQILWTAWKCFGNDGVKNRTTGMYSYKYSCNRCGSPMPKPVKAFVILTQSKLKQCVE